MTNTLALEGAKKNVLVNCIAPTAASRMTADVMPPDVLALLKPELVRCPSPSTRTRLPPLSGSRPTPSSAPQLLTFETKRLPRRGAACWAAAAVKM